MAEENPNAGAAQANEQREAQMAVQHIYLKDASFEAPSPQELDQSAGQPDINLNLSQRTNKIDEGRIEVILTVTVTAKQGEKTAFLCEVQYGGIFQFQGFTEEQMPYVVNVLCPNILFPYNRTQIANMVAAGGFFLPPIQPINFEGIFRQRMADAQSRAAQEQGASDSVQ
ncbi:MAG: protein-export chaperone SecB [Wenzhouxiangella sp.]